MCYFPPSDRGSRKAPPRRVRPLVCRHSAQARRRTLGWRLPIRSRALASSPHTAALARPLTHRKWLKQRGHFSFSILRRSHSNNIRQQQQQQHGKGVAMWRQAEHQYSNSGQVIGHTIGWSAALPNVIIWSRDLQGAEAFGDQSGEGCCLPDVRR